MGAMPKPSAGFRWFAFLAALGAWALVAVGGLVRVTESGLGCPDWPLCSGRVIPHSEKTAIFEYSHRATAATVTILLSIVAVWAWRRYRDRPDIVVPALVAVAFVPGQALLGAVVVWLELPSWIVGVHFLVGALMLGVAVVTAVAAWRDEPAGATPGFTRLSVWTAGVGLALVAAGAAVVSAHADDACGTQWPACNGTFVSGGGDATIQVVHRLLAYTVAALAVVLAVRAIRGAGPLLAGIAPLVAVIAQMGFGISLVLVGEGRAHEPLAALHVAGSGAVWASLVALAALVLPRWPVPSEQTRAAALARAR